MPTTPREIVTLVIVSILLCGGVVWMAGQFPKSHRSHVQDAAPTTAATPAPAVAATPSEYHRVARPGVMYLLEYVSSKTNSGVIAFLPGRPLKVVEDKGETIIVSDGAAKVEVSADKLTNDLDIAALAAEQDAQGQQQLAEYLARQQAIDEALRRGQNAAYDQDQRRIAEQRAAAVPFGASNPLERGPWHERGSLSVRRWIYNPDYPESRSPPSTIYWDGSGHPYWIDSYGRWRYDHR